ncbi:hypothetical protein ABIE27_001437 [Paenibacillus sp. 4624]
MVDVSLPTSHYGAFKIWLYMRSGARTNYPYIAFFESCVKIFRVARV